MLSEDRIKELGVSDPVDVRTHDMSKRVYNRPVVAMVEQDGEVVQAYANTGEVARVHGILQEQCRHAIGARMRCKGLYWDYKYRWMQNNL